MTGPPDLDLEPAVCEAEHHCITCGDEGTPMTVLALDTTRGLALCAELGGAHQSVEVALVGEVAAGDRVLVHAGTAIARLDREAAAA